MAREELGAFSRSGRSSLYGKRTEDARTKLAAATKEALRALWSALDYPNESEFLADLIESRVHGVDHIMSVQRKRVLAVAGIGQEQGEKESAVTR